MPRILRNHTKNSTPSSDSSESLNTTETPIKLEEVSEGEFETYAIPARKLSVEEAKLARKELEKHKNLLVLANKKVIRQLEGFSWIQLPGLKTSPYPLKSFWTNLGRPNPASYANTA